MGAESLRGAAALARVASERMAERSRPATATGEVRAERTQSVGSICVAAAAASCLLQ